VILIILFALFMPTLKYKGESLVVVIPAYNEESNILLLLKRVIQKVPEAQIIVVDGASKDKTTTLVKKLAKKYSQVSLLKQTKKLGRGHAVRLGFKEAFKAKANHYFLEIDADLSHQVEEIPQLVKETGKKTVAVASRYIEGAKIVNWPVWRKRQSKLANRLISLVLNLGLKDNTNGFRCYSRAAVEILNNHQYLTKGFIALSESAYLLKKNGYRFREIPSVFVDRQHGQSSANWQEVCSSLINVFRLRLS
jgi:dolichol-phosphate mannosyltransferase